MGRFLDIWDRSKDGKNVEKRSFLRYFIISTTAFVVLVGFLNQNSIVRWIKAGVEIRHQENRIQSLGEEIELMDGQIRSLTSSKDSLERYAREQFHFAEPGDDVFVTEEIKR